MKLYDPISEYSVISEVFRICGANANNYKIKEIIARVNDALDRYCHIAFRADGEHSFDDINQTSAPIDTQNIVSGTNQYKFSDFTEKILNLVKLTVLNADAVEIELIPERIENLSDSFTQVYNSTNTGTPTHYLKYGDYIYLRPYPDYSESNGLRAYFNRPAMKSEPVAVTIANGADADFTAVAHGLAEDDTILLLSDGTLPTGATADTIYHLVATVAADTFNVATNKGGTSLTTSSAGSGVHSFIETSSTPGIPSIHHSYLARHASLPFLIEKDINRAKSIMKLIGSDNPRDPYYGGDELAIKRHFSSRSKDIRNIIKPRITPFR